jgi:hypothetical protein
MHDWLYKYLNTTSNELYFHKDNEIINLFDSLGIGYNLSGNTIACRTKIFVIKIMLENNIKALSRLGDIVKKSGYIHFYSCKNDLDPFYLCMASYIFGFGTIEMINFLQSQLDIRKLNMRRKCFNFLMSRYDDNIEIVYAILSKLIGTIDNELSVLSNFAYKAASVNNINIFKYLCDGIIITMDPKMINFKLMKKALIWTTYDIDFLEYFLSKLVLLEKDIMGGINIVDSKDKLEVVLSYVDSGRLRLSNETVKLLNQLMDKN